MRRGGNGWNSAAWTLRHLGLDVTNARTTPLQRGISQKRSPCCCSDRKSSEAASRRRLLRNRYLCCSRFFRCFPVGPLRIDQRPIGTSGQNGLDSRDQLSESSDLHNITGGAGLKCRLDKL